ncbi:right-handed parallel beta-helix repeat-containing protein [Aquimarina agarivorans]|uniref:right-handed parallel beta-helix repeat-containing protein n=1 Tax=Aquimarina agarivorans TaxID=980584 RepID=UPI000248ED90|nr:right-handed parallel beta-helix repeat-containing protein [Aquimarina agarivorans]
MNFTTNFKLIIIVSILLGLHSCSEEESDTDNDVVPQIIQADPENPNSVVGPMQAISSLPYDAIADKEYIIDVEKWEIPNNRTAPVKTTDNLQAAIDWASNEGFGKIRLPKGHYLLGKYGNDIYQAGIELNNNMALLLDKEAVIEMAKNDKWNYCAISINNAKHVVVSGGTIIGDRDSHVYTPRQSDGSTVHDEGHLICINGESQFITIENTVLAKANGDGILMVGSKKGATEQKLKNIVVRNNNFSENRRQGISLVGSSEVLIENNEIHHTRGTSPQFGIDMEGAGRINKNITIRSNYFHHNTGGDIVNTAAKNVLVEGNVLTQGEGSTYIDGPIVYWKNADWTIKNNDITLLSPTVNNWNGIIMYSNDKPKINSATTYIMENTCNNCGFYMYKGADLVVEDNYLNNGHLAFWLMKNLTLENNKVAHPQKCWAYRFLEVSGTAKGNTYNEENFDIPLSETPWNGCWIN